MSTSPEIFARMTPDLIANTLEYIAQRMRVKQEYSDVNLIDETDVLHLRQIADWLEAQQKEQAQ